MTDACLPNEPFNLLVGGVGEESVEVRFQTFVALFGCAFAAACFAAKKPFGSGEQRPSPSIGVAMTVARIDKVLCNNTTGHLKTGDV